MSKIEAAYKERYGKTLVPLARALSIQLHEYLDGEPRIDRISARAKSIDRFIQKAKTLRADGTPKYIEPMDEIQDQIGARVITFYLSDVSRVADSLARYYRPIEKKDIVPESEWEFGYFGKHYIFIMPSDLVVLDVDPALVPRVFELQVKTLFQHAWSEAEHDLGYKPGEIPLTPEDKRRFAYTSAQAWGADRMFDDIFQERLSRAAATR